MIIKKKTLKCRRLLPCALIMTLILWRAPVSSTTLVDIGNEEKPEKEEPFIAMVCSENSRFGLLQLRGQSAFQLLRLSLIPVGAEVVPPGHFLLNTTATWTNRWAWKEGNYLVDAEILRMAFSLTYGVTDWMQLRLEIPFCLRGGGIMDGMIEGFHNTFGFGQAGRDLFPRDQFHIIFWRKDGTKFVLDSSHSGAGLEDLVLSGTFRLLPGGKWLPQTCLTLHLKLPTGNEEELYGSGSVDGGVALCFAKKIWKFYGYLGLQYTLFGSEEIAGIPMRQDQLSILSALEFPLTKRLSLIVQELFNTGAAVDYYEFSDATNEITLGLKAEIMPHTLLEFGFIENLFKFDNSPDFGIHCGLSRKF